MAIVIVLAIFLVCGVLLLLVGLPWLSARSGEQGALRSQMSRIVSSQRTGNTGPRSKEELQQRVEGLYEAASNEKVERVRTSQLTLEKKLRFAQWKMPALAFRAMEIFISVLVFYLVSLKFNKVMMCMALLSGPIFMRWLLGIFMERRFKEFDKDYAPFILSLISMLKTGMNAVTALDAASQGLEPDSLVREEVGLMLERLRYGVSEDKSIGAFGEDIYHPEIELFVQALLLSRRVGGNLSDTLDRLARQVRKRQHFRSSAKAAVSMQRGSIWFILAIMVGMETYLYFVYPEAVTDAIKDPTGWQIWQFGLVVILLGMFWVRQVTKIRV